MPEVVAREVCSSVSMYNATASPTFAPSTRTGRVTSWPLRMEGVIIGPQQPGTVMYSMRPPSLTGPSISLLGPTMSV